MDSADQIDLTRHEDHRGAQSHGSSMFRLKKAKPPASIASGAPLLQHAAAMWKTSSGGWSRAVLTSMFVPGAGLNGCFYLIDNADLAVGYDRVTYSADR